MTTVKDWYKTGLGRSDNNFFSWLVIALCVISWASFPLSLDRVFPYVTELATLVLLGLVIFVGLRTGRSMSHVRLGKYGWAFFVGYIVYVLALSLATLLNLSVGSFYQLALVVLKLGFLLLLIFFALDRAIIKKLFDIYSNAILVLALLGVALSIFLLFLPVESLGSIRVGKQGNSMIFLQNYGMGFIMAPLQFLCSTFYRVQSFSNEPGTFGFVLLPALFWLGLVRRSVWRTSGILVSVFLTFSAGAWLSLLLITPIAGIFWRRRIWELLRQRWVAVVLALAVAGLAGLVVVAAVSGMCAASNGGPSVDSAERSVTAYSDQRGRSVGKRTDQVGAAVGVLVANPEGVGAGQTSSRVGGSVAVGYMNAILESGFLGGLGYAVAVLSVLVLATGAIVRTSDPVTAAIGMSVITILLMAFLRTQIDASFWQMFLIASLFVVRSTSFEQSMDGR